MPEFLAEPLALGLADFNRKIPHFSSNIGQIIGLESRTSSPISIPRNLETLEHVNVKGLYPCGEGAGYAGGIISAAIDGINCVDAISTKLTNS